MKMLNEKIDFRPIPLDINFNLTIRDILYDPFQAKQVAIALRKVPKPNPLHLSLDKDMCRNLLVHILLSDLNGRHLGRGERI